MVALLCDDSQLPAATITSNVDWLPTSPLDAMKGRPLSDPAISSRLGTPADPVWVEWAWNLPIDLLYAGLFKTNLRQSCRWRLEAWGPGGDLAYTSRRPDGEDQSVVSGLFDPAGLRWGADNLFRGDWPDKLFYRYPTNVHAVVPDLPRVTRLRWTLYGPAYRPDRSDDTGYRIGLGWAGDGLLFVRHAGDGEGYKPGDTVLTADGGGRWVEPGVGARTATIDRSVSEPNERDTFFDLAVQVNLSGAVVFLPDVDNPPRNTRYGGLFTKTNDHSHKHLSDELSAATVELIEVTL